MFGLPGSAGRRQVELGARAVVEGIDVHRRTDVRERPGVQGLVPSCAARGDPFVDRFSAIVAALDAEPEPG
jgi:hypothetical protein